MLVQPLVRAFDLQDRELEATRIKQVWLPDLGHELDLAMNEIATRNPTAIRIQVDLAIPREILHGAM